MATATRTLPGSYSEMYPGRFLKADMLKGKKVTVTVTAIEGEALIGENNKEKDEWIVRIKERPLQLVLNKTNAFCLYRMFGGDPHSWIGKRITIYPTTTKFGRDTLDCIRVWGSPDIIEDQPITVPQGRKKAWETVMHRTGVANAPTPPGAPPDAKPIHPRILEIFPLLGWGPNVCEKWMLANAGLSDEERISKLEQELEREN